MRSMRGLAVLAVLLSFQAFLLYRAFHDGPMAGLIPWDDCLILQRGLHNLRILGQASSPLDLIAGFASLVIHSPVSDLQAMAGLTLSGGASWGPYALNGAAALLVLYAVLFRAGRPGGFLFAALLLFVLVQPVTIGALTFVKADWKGGLLIAAALVMLYQAVALERPGLKLWGGALLGLALIAKLTAFYMPVFAVLALLGFEILALVARPPAKGELGARLAAARVSFSPALGLAVIPYIGFFVLSALGQHNLLAYIRFAVGETWTDGLTPWGRAFFYSPAASGGGAWGHLHWLALIFVAAALAVSARARDRLYPAALVLFLALAAILAAPLILAHTSNWEFEAGFLGVVIGLVLISIRVFAEALPRFGGPAALAVVLLLGLTAPLSAPYLMPDVGPGRPAELRRLKEVYGLIGEAVLARAPRPEPRVRLLYEHAFAPFPNLSLDYFAKTGRLIDIDRIDDLSKPAEAVPELLASDFLLTAVPSGPGPIRGFPQRFPTSRDPAAADRLAQGLSGFGLIGRYPIPGGEIRLYQKLAVRFSDRKAVSPDLLALGAAFRKRPL